MNGVMRRERERGFTMIELMVVVAIVGVLSTIAIPAYLGNARKAKTSEAIVNIRKIYVASRNYILESNNRRAGINPIAPQFPEAIALTPAAICCTFSGKKCAPNPADWSANSWTALMFSMDDPYWYRYEYMSTGSTSPGPGSNFTVAAHGDLNCNGVYSTFEMFG